MAIIDAAATAAHVFINKLVKSQRAREIQCAR